VEEYNNEKMEKEIIKNNINGYLSIRWNLFLNLTICKRCGCLKQILDYEYICQRCRLNEVFNNILEGDE